MLKKFLCLAYRVAIWLVAIVVTLLVSIALFLHFWVLPHIDNYRKDIEIFASRVTEHKVHIGQIQADWKGINPQLILRNIVLFDRESREALVLNNSEVTLSWLSIPLLEPHIAKLTLHAPHLTIRRTLNGDIFVAGILIPKDHKPTLSNWLLRQSSIALHHASIEWIDEQRSAPLLQFTQLEFLLERPAWKGLLEQHYFYLQARASAITPQPILVSGTFYGDELEQLKAWRGEVDVHLLATELSAVQPWWDKPLNISNFFGDIKLKMRFANKSLRSASGEIDISKLNLPHFNGDFSLKGRLAWQPLDTAGYRLDFYNVMLKNAQGLVVEDLSGHYEQKGAQQVSSTIRLAHMDAALLLAYQMPSAWLEALSTAEWSGRLNNVTLNWQDATNYRLEFEFEKLSTSALMMSTQLQIPQLTNFTGKLTATQSGGMLSLNTDTAQVYAKNQLRWPLVIEHLQGDVQWLFGTEVITVKTDNLSFSTPQLKLTLTGQYQKNPRDGDQIDITARFNGDVKQAFFYYPIVLGDATLHWLDTSILAGTLQNGVATIKGKLSEFPFTVPNSGVFRVSADLNNGLIEYGNGWPMIEGLDAKLLFEGQQMTIAVNGGQTYGNQLLKSMVKIPNLAADEPILTVNSELKGNVADVLKFVNNSPIHEVTQSLTDGLAATGQGRLALKLHIPMQHLEKATYQGAYQLNDASLSGQHIPSLTRIRGILGVTEKGLSANNVHVVAWDTPMYLNLVSDKNNTLTVHATGRTSDALLAPILGTYSKFFIGSAGWNADAWINKSGVDFDVRSDLVGMRLNLPLPLTKSTTEALELKVIKREKMGNQTWLVNFGDRLNAKILASANAGKWQLERGALYLGKTKDDWANDLLGFKGLDLYGNLDFLNADAWLTSLGGIGGAFSQSSLPYKFDLTIKNLEMFSRRIHKLKLKGASSAGGMSLDLDGPDLSGAMEWSGENGGKLTAHFINLTIPKRLPSLKIASDNERVPTQYPALEVSADNFTWDGRNLGMLNLSAYHQDNDWVIKGLKLTQPDSALQATGKWGYKTQHPMTSLNVQWNVSDLGLALGHLRHENLIKGGRGELRAKLNFAGDPLSLTVNALEGDMQFEMHKGTVLKVQPGVGRLLGVLSLQNLPRRLTLDFRDLFSSGFAFDKIAANVRIADGIMRSDDLVLSGPAADVHISGETNLQKETQRLNVKVLPRVSDSLSLAALAGGPLVGAVAFLAQKVLKDPLNKIASSSYIIIGTWDNPQEEKSPNADVSINPINH